MSAFGDLWDLNHQFTGSVPVTWETIQALREHLTTEHRSQTVSSVSSTLALNRAELHRHQAEMARVRSRFLVYLRRKVLWNNELLKKLNQEGVLL